MRVESGSAAGVLDEAKGRQAKLEDGARQFEAMLLGEMLKPFAAKDGLSEEGTGGGGEGEADTMRGFGVEALAKSLAAGKGFGLAERIVRQVTAEARGHAGAAGGTKVL